MKLVAFHLGERTAREVALEELDPRPDEPDVVFWVRVPSVEGEAFERVVAAFGIPEQQVLELRDADSMPTMKLGDDCLHLILEWGEPDSGAATRFQLWLTTKLCLVVEPSAVPAVREFEATYARELRFARSTNFMMFLVLDALVDGFTRAVARLDERVDAVSARVHAEAEAALYADIVALERHVLTTKRVLTYARDVLMRLSGRRIPIVSDAARDSLGDVYAHAQALMASVDAQREIVAGLHNSYMAIQAQRLNETMKLLTVFASIMLPMTLVVGLYGMNFDMPEFGWRFGYLFAWGMVLGSGLVTYLFFRRRGLF